MACPGLLYLLCLLPLLNSCGKQYRVPGWCLLWARTAVSLVLVLFYYFFLIDLASTFSVRLKMIFSSIDFAIIDVNRAMFIHIKHSHSRAWDIFLISSPLLAIRPSTCLQENLAADQELHLGSLNKCRVFFKLVRIHK